jgi:hypothetical protein
MSLRTIRIAQPVKTFTRPHSSSDNEKPLQKYSS